MPVGLDTNVLVYSPDSEAGWKHERAVGVIEEALKSPGGYIVSSQVLAKTIYIAGIGC